MDLQRLWAKVRRKKINTVAFDVGTSTIKVVEVEAGKDGPEVLTTGKFATPADALGTPLKEDALSMALKEAVEVTGIRGYQAVMSITGPKVITRHIRMPVMNNKELASAVKFEAEKYIPIPVKDLIINHVNLGEVEGEDNEKQLQVLLIAAPAELIYQYYRAFEKAELEVTAIDIHPIALWRSMGGVLTEPSQGCVAIADIGAGSTHFVVVENGLFKFNRVLPVGGNQITEVVAQIYGLSFADAARLKEEQGKVLDEGVGVASTAEVQMDMALRTALGVLANELRRSIDFYKTIQRGNEIERIILCGGGSRLQGLPAFLSKELATPVEVGTLPLAGPANSENEKALTPDFAVALGLALREVV